MTTLTETAYYTRKGLKYSLIGLVAYIVLRYTLTWGWALYQYLYPPPPPPPTMEYGLLPRIQFPSIGNYDYQFQLETPNGSFPKFSDRAVVYFMPYQRASFSAGDQARQLAENLGFRTEPQILSPEIYQWSRNVSAPMTLQTNIITGAFILNYQWQADTGLLQEKQLPGREQSLMQGQQFFSKLTQNITDIDFPSGIITYLKSNGTAFVPAISLSEADFVRIDFFRSPIIDEKSEYKVLTPKPDEGIIHVIFSGSKQQDRQVVAVEFNYFPIDYIVSATNTYPLKPIEVAWNDLSSGKGYIAKPPTGGSKIVTIRRIELGYYDAKQAQQFLQPIYIFEGDDDFIAYVSAIDDFAIQP